MKIWKDEKGRWLIDFNCKGHRINRIIGSSKREAEEEAVRIKAEILAGKFVPMKEKGKHSNDGSFAAHAEEFLELYSKQHKKSWARDEASIKNLLPFFKEKNLTEINSQQVERYTLKRKADGVSQSTVNRELACLKTMFEKAVEWGKLKENPARRLKKFRENPPKERILTVDEMRRLISASSSGIQPVLVTALNTGMRKNEILSLRWRDVDFLKGYILIEDSKSGRSRKIPMNGQVLEVLRGLKQEGEFVFANAKTGSYIKDVKTAFKGACRRANIKGLRFHDLRHTAASKMVEGGIDLVTVSKILGHASIQMTMRYAHPTPENMRLAVEKLGKFFEDGGAKVESIEIRRPVTDLKSFI